MAKRYDQAYECYLESCLPLCSFKDQQATILTNMAQCSLSLGKYEQAFDNLQCALKYQRNASDIDPTVQIKMKYRLAQVLVRQLRDYTQAEKILKHLKKYCNTYGKIDMFKEANALMAKASEYRNTRDAGKVKVKEVVERAAAEIAEHTSDKIEIRLIDGKGRGVFALKKIHKGELLMVCKAMFA